MIRLSKSSISESEIAAASKVLKSEYLGMGANVNEFEEVLSSYFKRTAICVVNGTSALHLALQSIGLNKDDEVLVQSLTYVASYQAISATGAIPISCDVDLETLTLDWRDAEKKISNRTKAIMPVHYSGGVGDLDSIYALANKYNLRVIEDAAHAFGTNYKNQYIGSFGDIACFSFDGIKNITSGEGGCIVTDDEKLIKKIRDARLLGVKKDTEARFSGRRSWDFDVTDQGWRYHMSNIMAAIGLVQFQRKDQLIDKRRYLAKLYDLNFKYEENLKLIAHNYDQVAPHIYVIQVNEGFCRSGIRDELKQKGIETGIHYYPNHFLSFYKNNEKKNIEITEKIYSQLITLPLHPDLSKDDVNYVSSELLSILRRKND